MPNDRAFRDRLPAHQGGRQVRVDGQPVGAACSLSGLAEIMRRAGGRAGGLGWAGMDEIDVADSPVIEWHGGGPEVW
ncbi:hypothetical protein OG834_07365 [Streptomyces mirabilis]|nr:hypothetical protein [Streptomyces mirabilis]